MRSAGGRPLEEVIRAERIGRSTQHKGGRLYAVDVGLGVEASSASIVINVSDDLQQRSWVS